MAGPYRRPCLARFQGHEEGCAGCSSEVVWDGDRLGWTHPLCGVLLLGPVSESDNSSDALLLNSVSTICPRNTFNWRI